MVLVGLLVVLICLIALLIMMLKPDYDEILKKGILENNLHKVERALKNGADANMEIDGTSALVLAIKHITYSDSSLKIANEMIKAGADVKDHEVIITAMRKGASHSFNSDIEYFLIPSLITNGADINTKIEGNNDVYCYAIKNSLSWRVIKAAVGSGADVNSHVDNEPYNALEHLIRNGQHELVSTVVRLGATPPKSIDGVPIKDYVLNKYGDYIAKTYYKVLF